MKLNFKNKFFSMFSSFNKETSDKGVLVYDGDIKDGVEVFIEDENGELVKPEDGDYKIGETIYTIKDGKFVVIEEEKPEEKPEDFKDEKPEEVDPNKPEETNSTETNLEEETDPNVEPEMTVENLVESLKGELEIHTNIVTEMATKLAELTEKFNSMSEKYEALESKTVSYDEKFSKLDGPQDKPAKVTVKDTKKVKYSSKAAEILASDFK